MPLAGKALVERLADQFLDVGADEVVVATGDRTDMFRTKFEPRDAVSVTETDADLYGAALLEVDSSEEFVCATGDIYVSDGEIRRVVERLRGGEPSVLVEPSERDRGFGFLTLGEQEFLVSASRQADETKPLTSTGVCGLKPSLLREIEACDGDLTEALDAAADHSDIHVGMVRGVYSRIDSPESMFEVGREARKTLTGHTSEDASVHDTAYVSDEAVVREGVEVGPNAAVLGQSYVGVEAEIGAGAVLEDSSVHSGAQMLNADVRGSAIWEDAVLDPNTSVERSLIAEESVVRSGTSITQSFIGPRSHIGVNNSIRGVKFVPDARTDLSEISK
jgi:glucose-1-phosphate thymidylyltransferase